MAVQGGAEEDVYATLLLSDSYLPGAVVLAHSLRDAGTTKKLAVLVTLDTVSEEVVTELQGVFDYVIPVSRIQNSRPENLQLMNRTDLHSAFTKINLWKLAQFRKIVYIDADIVAYRAPDELFDIAAPFSAAPDIGWPDIFNTGVMVLTPNLKDYNALVALAEENTSFDGADQGLINIYFGGKFNRISFTYNVTPSGHYQYTPAYLHFKSSISLVHFIGSDKPWFSGRRAGSGGPYDEMTGSWWSVYDRHYSSSSGTSSDLVRYFTKGEYHPYGNKSAWNSQRQSSSQGSQYGASNFPTTVYQTAPAFVPSDSWYHPPAARMIFPWEAHRSPPSRVFDDDPVWTEEEEVEEEESGAEDPGTPTGEMRSPSLLGESYSVETSTVGQNTEPTTPTTPSHNMSSESWSSFTLTNAWDEVPEIERYVDAMQKYRRMRSAKGFSELPNKATEFPSDIERPSLPVTPVPTRRPPQFWFGPVAGSGSADQKTPPAAKGVPAQNEWLEKLSGQPTEEVLLKLESNSRDGSDWAPRPSPFGTDKYQPATSSSGSRSLPSNEAGRGIAPLTGSARGSSAAGAAPILEPSYAGPGPAFEKGENILTADTSSSWIPTSRPVVSARASAIPEPSYAGPGPSFERGENIP
ncbi:glycosyltransferase family 8 protein [Durotheca rogersii]|uniref:glycosyltransferase family 8 protein n=1 Tax=Durotheca rogersii TaxID=419775 RepID=UPI002220B713|nr:glycosyltransferase family 8 protein [Durotheca rogersii]KAI5867141.1 glycosyltransferase family 8 protein [Durotheca rogersii]